jgi:hypothetical protein
METTSSDKHVSLPRCARRLALPVGLLLGFALMVLASAFVRGTLAQTPRVPTAVEDGPVCQVVETSEEGRHVRCTKLLAFSLEEVWAAVTDYDNYGDICSCIRAKAIAHEPDGRCRLEARANSGLLGSVPFAVELRHEQELFEYVALWDQADDDVLVNRGRWVLTPQGPSHTLVSLHLEVQVRNIPTFILRNQSLHRLRDVVLAVERRLQTGSRGEPW